MKLARTSFNGENDKKAYVAECENDFEKRLDRAVFDIVSKENNRIIALSGPTCAGKTTTANKIVSEFKAMGRCVHTISIDDYYFDRDYLLSVATDEKGIDFDSVNTIDLQALKNTVEEIFSEKTVFVPKFDFKSGKRTEMRRIDIDDGDIFMFEGIQAVYPEVTALLGKHSYVSVFISVLQPLQVGECTYQPEELRLLRRLVRDYNFRNASPEFTLKLWQNVRKNEEANIFPYADKCDVIIDSLMPYEINVLKPYIKPILRTIHPTSEYYEFATREVKKLAHVDYISKRYIPENSVYHEFLG